MPLAATWMDLEIVIKETLEVQFLLELLQTKKYITFCYKTEVQI